MHLKRIKLLAGLFWPLISGMAALHGQTPAGLSPVREIRDIPYVTGGLPSQRLDLYLPQAPDKPRPLLVWIHGGGWEGGNKSGCPAKGNVSLGYAAASIEYRLSSAAIFPAQIEDCKAAIRFLRAHAAEYGIDPKRIGVWGGSAGGHLVALLGVTGNIRDFDVGENLDQSSAVQCVIDWFGPTDFLHWGNVRPGDPEDTTGNAVARLIGGRVSEHEDAARRASPIYYVHPGSAPFLIMHGDQDPTVPLQQSQDLNAALLKAGVESTLVVLTGAGHGGSAFGSAENTKRIEDFTRKYLGDSDKATASNR